MRYTPSAPRSLWDTWLVDENGDTHVFYLHLPPGDGIGHAVSQDGRYWSEDPSAPLGRDEGVDWIGSGSVWPVDGGWMMNFSEARGASQRIRFAESADLHSWTVLDGAFEPDPRWYRSGESGRWDCMNVLRLLDGTYEAHFTATPMNGPGIGRAVSDDGRNWLAAPPPRIDPGPRGWSGLHDHVEVGGYAAWGGNSYLLLCGMGFGSDLQGAYLFRQDDEGTFRPVALDSTVLSCRSRPMTYFPRIRTVDDALVVNHHSIDRHGHSWLAPLKRLELSNGGRPELHFHDTTAPEPDASCLDDSSHGLVVSTRGRDVSPLARFSAHGVAHVVLDVRLRPADGRSGGLGFALKLSDGSWLGVVCRARGESTFHEIAEHDWSSWSRERPRDVPAGRVGLDSKPVGIRPNERHEVRLLARLSMFEMYVDGRLVQAYTAAADWTGDVWAIVEEGTGEFAWKTLEQTTEVRIHEE